MNTKKDNKILIYLSAGVAVILLAIGAYFLQGTWFKASLLQGTVIKPADNYVVGIKSEFSTYDAVSGTPLTVKLFTQGASATTPFNGVQLYLTVPSYLTPTSVTATDPNMTAKPPRNMGNGVWQILLYGGNQTADMTNGFATVTFSVNGTVTADNVQILASGTTVSNLTGDQNTNVHPLSESTLFSVGPTAPVTYTVTSSVTGGNGTAAPATQTVNAGSSATITITPDNGYHLATLTDNTVAVDISKLLSASSSTINTVSPSATKQQSATYLIYTISNVQANHAVVATFAPNTTPVNPYIPLGVRATGNTTDQNIKIDWSAPYPAPSGAITGYKIYRQWYACFIETARVCDPPVFVGQTNGTTLTFTDTFAVTTTFDQPYAYLVTSLATIDGTPNVESEKSEPSNPVYRGSAYTMTLTNLTPNQGLIGDTVTATGTGFATQNFVHFVGPVSGYAGPYTANTMTNMSFTLSQGLATMCFPPMPCPAIAAQMLIPGRYQVSIANLAGESNAIAFVVLSSNGNINSWNGNNNSTNDNNNGTNTNTNGANSNVNSGNGNNNGTNTNTNSSGNKCADTNNDLQYDACSLSGNGPTCTTAASCTNIPTGVTATADPHSQNIFVRWNPLNVDIAALTDPQGLNGYKVYRSATCMEGQDPNTCTDWVEIGQTNGAVVYVDTTGTPGASYVYAVSSIVAQVTGGKSMPSNRVTVGTSGSGSISSDMLILPFATKAPYHLTAGGVGDNITWTSSNSGLVSVTTNDDGSADITVINSGSNIFLPLSNLPIKKPPVTKQPPIGGMPAGNVNGGVSFITASGSTGYATMLVVVWPRGDTDGNFVVDVIDQNNVANGWSIH